MLKTGSDVLFQEPEFETRRLRRSVVVEVSPDRFSIRFVADPFDFAPDQEVLMYFNGKREFMQQLGRVCEIAESQDGLVFEIEPIGDPVSAEARQTYRVSTISAGLTARLGDEADLPVQDLSATGLAVVASGEYALGQRIDVAVVHAQVACHGSACVQSIRELSPGRIRYGLRALGDGKAGDDFLQGLRQISLAVQRDQLART